MNKIIFLSIILIMGFTQLYAQPGKGKVSSARNLEIANQLLAQNSYFNAVNYLEDILSVENDNLQVMYQLAESYYKSRNYKKAQFYFGRVLTYDNPATFLNYPLIRFYLAQSYKRNGRYAEAREQFSQFIDSYDGENSNLYVNWSKAEVTGCTMAQMLEPNPKTRVSILDKPINSGYTDYAPYPLGDSVLIFSSVRSKSFLKSADNAKFSNIYVAEKRGKRWSNPLSLKGPQRLPNYHTGHATYSFDNKRIYFTRCPENNNQLNAECKIYVTEFNDSYWTIPLQIKQVNVEGYKSSSPCLVRNGNGDRIYFSSNRPGSRGGSDIWYVDRDVDGNFSEATNIGFEVNTSNNDLTPFYDETTSTLYFSSNGYPGLGGYDVFKVKKEGSKWGTVENAGKPINSPVDDLYFVKAKGTSIGYLSSNRINEYGIASETCCDKIFEIDFNYTPPPPKLSPREQLASKITGVEGIVYGASDAEIIELSGAKIQVFEKINASEALLVSEMFSSAEPYFLPLEKNKAYQIVYSHPDYNSEVIEVSNGDMNVSSTLRRDPYLIKIKKAPVQIDPPIQEEPVKVDPPKQEEPMKVDPPIQEEPIKVEPPKQEEPVMVDPPKQIEPEPVPVETPKEPEPEVEVPEKSETTIPTSEIPVEAPISDKVIRVVTGKVFSYNGTEQVPLNSALASVYKLNGAEQERYAELFSSAEGYKFNLDEEGTYIVYFSEPNHLKSSFMISTAADNTRELFEQDVVLFANTDGTSFQLENIQFETNSDVINSKSRGSLNQLAVLLTDNPEAKIEIGAHTDAGGEASYNMTLSTKRANSVMNYLIGKGVSPEQLISKGYGETLPIAPNDTPENKQLNRRVEFKIIGS